MEPILDSGKIFQFGAVLSFFRYRARQRQVEEGCLPRGKVVPDMDLTNEDVPKRQRMPSLHANPETVFLCRRVYDFKLKRILKNPTPS